MDADPRRRNQQRVAARLLSKVQAKRAEVVRDLEAARAAGDPHSIAELEEQLAAADRLTRAARDQGGLPLHGVVQGGRR